MNPLDDNNRMKELDKSGQLEWISDWKNMLTTAIQTGLNLDLPSELVFGTKKKRLDYSHNYQSIVICGMGGSAISGDYLASVLTREKKFHLPIQVVRGYDLPKYVSSKTLVLGVSYSGNTRETLSCISQALMVQAPIILLSSGGTVQETVLKYSLPWVPLPKGYQPRAAFPIIFGTILGIFLKVFPDIDLSEQLSELTVMIDEILAKNGLNISSSENPAKQLAIILQESIPVIVSSDAALAMRWKGQMNENSKMVAFYDVFPELMHNSIQGWENNSLKNLEIVVLKLQSDSTEITDKINFCLEIANKNVAKNPHFFEFDFKFYLSNILAATLFGDLVSLYLAFLHSIDPSEIRLIKAMKEEFEPKLSEKFDLKQYLLSI